MRLKDIKDRLDILEIMYSCACSVRSCIGSAVIVVPGEGSWIDSDLPSLPRRMSSHPTRTHEALQCSGHLPADISVNGSYHHNVQRALLLVRRHVCRGTYLQPRGR